MLTGIDATTVVEANDLAALCGYVADAAMSRVLSQVTPAKRAIIE